MTSSIGNRVVMTAEAHNALQKTLDHAMAEVYADRLGEIAGAEPGKSYGNTIVAARINQTRIFSFQPISLFYVNVRDTNSMYGYGSDHSVNLATSNALVHADQRRARECAWDNDMAFSLGSNHALLLGELTVEAARKLANGLVDYVRDYMESLLYQGDITPFMTVVAGHVLVHDSHTGAPLGKDWTGICVDSRDAKKHWYIGHSRGERSFSALAAKDLRAAILESQLLIRSEAEELAEA